MRIIDSLRKKLYRLNVPAELAHMRALHPDFALQPADSGVPADSYELIWRRRRIGRTRPLRELQPATTSSCFIVASGPSLATLDFTQLRGQICCGVNGSIVQSLRAEVPFRYHLITDRTFVRDRFELVRALLRHSAADCLFSYRALSEICEREPDLLTRDRLFHLNELNADYGQPRLKAAAFDTWAQRHPGLWLHPETRLAGGRVGFSACPERGVFTAQTVVFAALQVCLWLGFKQIFILGMDLGGAGYTRFYEPAGGALPTRLDRDFQPYIVPSFELAARYAATQGSRIYNVSPHSRLPDTILPKLEFAQALSLSRAAGVSH